MAGIFDKFSLGGLKIPNRIIRAATVENRSTEKGEPSPAMAAMFRELAEGGVGLIVTGGCYVQEHGRSLRYLTGIHNDDVVGSLSRLVEVVHEAGGKIAVQIYHAGRQTRQEVIHEVPRAPSAVKDTLTWVTPREMSGKEIEETIETFGKAAERGVRAGFDAVEILAGHGYLINQFLSQRTNRRTDKWGGSLENRAGFLMETVKAVKQGTRGEIPVMVKINSNDNMPRGFTLEESCWVCSRLEEGGVDAIEITGGTFESALEIARGGIPKKEILEQLSGAQKAMARLVLPLMKRRFAFKESYFLENARVIRSRTTVPLILAGGNRDPRNMEKILAEGHVDLLSLSRPFVREPGLINRWKKGDLGPASCISCNRCFVSLATDRPVKCLLDNDPAEDESVGDFYRSSI